MTWNPLKRKNDADNAAQVAFDSEPEGTGKGRPTPKRKQAEAENLHPIVPKDRKASRKVEREKLRVRQDSEYQAMRTGDVNHMPKAERLASRVYVRDYIDARWNIAEFFVPIAFIILLGSFIVSSFYPVLSVPLLILMYVYLFASVIDIAIMWRGLKRKLIAKFGEQSVAKGSRMASYAWSRTLQMRRWRMPRPSSKKHGNWPK
ncbi:DUF3043 domain-containing protein [Bifidobacterium aquikefiricola]|uniref:DUF3043 domain-containing protein n=1 Tax=Bifidobacterium aquikefiricola TaxID=3059038 RepID=A0AB39U564_9BIFI